MVFGWKTNFLYGLGNFPDLVEALGTLLDGTKYILVFLKDHWLSCFNANPVNSVEGFEKLLIVFQGATFSQEQIPNHTPYTFFLSTYTLLNFSNMQHVIYDSGTHKKITDTKQSCLTGFSYGLTIFE